MIPNAMPQQLTPMPFVASPMLCTPLSPTTEATMSTEQKIDAAFREFHEALERMMLENHRQQLEIIADLAKFGRAL